MMDFSIGIGLVLLMRSATRADKGEGVCFGMTVYDLTCFQCC